MAMTRERYEELRASSRHSSSVKSGYRVVLTPHFEKSSSMTAEQLRKVDLDNEPIEFDMLNDVSVSASSELTTYPLVNGDTVADHMIRQPVSMTLSGVYSLYGNKPSAFRGDNDRLTNIEQLFERMKDSGIMVSVVTMRRGAGTDSKQRFKARDNMVLSSIEWTESQASLSFSFTLTEALTVLMDEPKQDYTDENLPSITDAKPLDFTDTLIDWESIDKIVIVQLRDVGLITDDFLQFFGTWVGEAWKTIGLGAAGGIVVGSVSAVATIAGLAAIFGSLAAIPVAGWVTAAVLAVAGFIAGAIWAAAKEIERKKAEVEYSVKQFKLYKDDKKNDEECKRFTNYIGSIHQQLDYLENVMQVYGISSSEEQECMLFIDNVYYIFSFSKNNTQTTSSNIEWKLNIQDAGQELNADIPSVRGTALSDISQCTSSNMLFRTTGGGGYWVYLINRKLFGVQNATYGTEAERQKAIDDCNNDLTSYCVFVSQTSMDDFNEKLRDIVVNAMTM